MESASLSTARAVTPPPKPTTEPESPFKAYSGSPSRPRIQAHRAQEAETATSTLAATILADPTYAHPPMSSLSSSQSRCMRVLLVPHEDPDVSTTPLMSPTRGDIASPVAILRQYESLHDDTTIPTSSLDDRVSGAGCGTSDRKEAVAPSTLDSTAIVLYQSPKPLNSLIHDAFQAIYSTRDPVYARYTQEANKQSIHLACKTLEPLIPLLLAHHGVIMTSGSDGRYENIPCASPHDLVMAFPTKPTPSIQTELQSVVDTNPSLFDRKIEIIELDQSPEHLITRMAGSEVKIIPTIPLDAEFLVGDRTTFESYQDRAFEATRLSSCVKKFGPSFVKKAFVQLRRDYYGEEGKHIDIAAGTLYVDPEHLIKTSKYGMLRSMQYLLAKIIVDGVKSERISDAQYRQVSHIPTIERLSLIRKWGLLKATPEKVERVAWAYSIAMLWHHLGYCVGRDSPTSIHVPPDTLREVTETIVQFIKGEDIYTTILESKSA